MAFFDPQTSDGRHFNGSWVSTWQWVAPQADIATYPF
jgi:hypothetical protein